MSTRTTRYFNENMSLLFYSSKATLNTDCREFRICIYNSPPCECYSKCLVRFIGSENLYLLPSTTCSVVVSVLHCQSRGRGFNSHYGRNLVRDFSVCHLANGTIMSTSTIPCQWKDETARERNGQPPSYAKAKKMKLLTLHTHGCPRASLRAALLLPLSARTACCWSSLHVKKS